MKPIQLLFLFSFVICQTMTAQNDTLVGILRNVEQEPIKRQKVTLGKVNPKTVKTDRFGLFTIPAADLNDTLYIYIKKEKRELNIPVNGYDALNITLRSKSFNIDYTEIDPVILQARERDRNKMISSSTMNQAEIERTRCTDIPCVLQRMSGVIVSQAGVQIRGISSVNSKTTALIVLDGIPMSESLPSIPIQTVEEITILKDGSMYGAQGANGVVVIRTSKN